MKFILPLLSVSLILAACMSFSEGAPAPQVTPPSPALGEGAGVRETPPPTETPLPTLTPTPVAMDGIAEDAKGDKLAYLNGEWLALPKLDAEYAKLMVDGEKVVAVDAEGEVAFEYDMAAKNWVEVNTLPDWVRTLESAGNTVDAERGIVYDAEGKVLGATGADVEWTEYPNGMVPLAAQDGSGEPPLEVPYAENFEDAIALVTGRLPWNNLTVRQQPTEEMVARSRVNYDRYLAQLFKELETQGRAVYENVDLYATDRKNYYVPVSFGNALLPGGREVTMLVYKPAYGALAEVIFIDIDTRELLEQLRNGSHDYEIVGP